MKLKLVSGKLVKEEDKSDFINIVTPHGHKTVLPYKLTHIGSYDDHSLESFGDIIDDNAILTIISSSVLGECVRIGLKDGAIKSWYNIVLKQWEQDDRDITIDTISSIIARIESDMVEFILQYDRECENARNLQIIGEFCVHLLGRSDVLDTFTLVKKPE